MRAVQERAAPDVTALLKKEGCGIEPELVTCELGLQSCEPFLGEVTE